MNKTILFLIMALFTAVTITGQTQFDNASFEEWESIPGTNVPEPVNWSSLKSSDNTSASSAAPIVWGQSEDAHTGNYSLYLSNVYISIINYVSPGMITNGRVHVAQDFDPEKSSSYTDVHDARWHTDLVHLPDSLTGWFKCQPTDGDFGTVKVILHQDSASIPGDNRIAVAYYELPGYEVDQWTRFSVPFQYESTEIPHYILSTITSGNGFFAKDGSKAWFDDIELIYNDGTGIIESNDTKLNIFYSNKLVHVKILDSQIKNISLRIIDLSGRIVYQQDNIKESNHDIRLETSPGIYFVNAILEGGAVTKKILVK